MNRLKKFFNPFKKAFPWFKKTRTRNKIIVIVLMLAVAFFVRNQVVNANQQPEYITQKVEKTDIEQVVSETGNVNSSGIVDVYSSSTGIVEAVYIKDGDMVKANQDLFTVRSTATAQEKAAAYATWQSASSAYNQALNTYRDRQATAERVEDDVKGHDTDESFTQRATRTTAQAARDSAYEAVQAAEASLRAAEYTYAATQNTTVRATAAGTVANFSLKVGDKVTAGNNVSPGVPVLAIGDFSIYTVTLELNEVDIPKVKVGQAATFTLDAFPDGKFRGEVIHADTVGSNANGVITYTVIVKITDPDESIRPTMTANVDIVVDRAQDTLTVPNSAIKPYQDGKAVQVIDSETKSPKYVPVEVGIKSPERTQIISGIGEGTEVITGAKNGVVQTQGFFGN